jgi:hypothetical protein
MSICRYCDDDITTKSVCKFCLKKMIYQFDAINTYGLTKLQLKKLFSVGPHHQLSLSKYYENDLCKLQEHLILITPKINKQYDKLIECKQNIIILKKKKENIENLLNILFNKFDDKYLKIYNYHILKLILRYCKSDFDYTSIAFHICLVIEEKINNEKLTNDKIIELDNFVNNLEFIKYKNQLFDLPCYDNYIYGDGSLMECITEFNNFVKNDIRFIETNKIIESTVLKTYVKIIKKTDEYKKFIKSGDIDEIDDFISEINIMVKQLKKRDKKICIISKYVDEKNLIINKYDNTQDVYNKYIINSISLDDAVDFIEKSNLIDTIKNAVNEFIKKYNYKCKSINFTFEYFDKYVINANTITKIIIKHIINNKSEWTDFNFFKLRNSIYGASKLNKIIKNEINIKLFDYHKNDDDIPLILQTNNTIDFFIVERCDQLKLCYTQLNDTSYEITKINNPTKYAEMLVEVKNIIKKYIE